MIFQIFPTLILVLTPCDEGISKTLHANTDGTMSHVRSASFGRGIVVHIDYTVEVVGNDFGYVMEPIEVVLAIDEGGEIKGGEVANSSFIGGEYSMISVQRLEDLMVLRFF